jgi:hypothetical protein
MSLIRIGWVLYGCAVTAHIGGAFYGLSFFSGSEKGAWASLHVALSLFLTWAGVMTYRLQQHPEPDTLEEAKKPRRVMDCHEMDYSAIRESLDGGADEV